MYNDLKNPYKDNENYVTKQDIRNMSKSKLKRFGFSSVSKKEILETFDKCDYKMGVTGNPYNQYQQKHTKYVNLLELYRKIFKH